MWNKLRTVVTGSNSGQRALTPAFISTAPAVPATPSSTLALRGGGGLRTPRPRPESRVILLGGDSFAGRYDGISLADRHA